MPALLLVVCALLIAASACTGQPEQSPSREEPLPEPASHAAAGLRKTELELADRAAWREVLQWPAECEETFEPVAEDYAGLTFYPLAAGEYLVEVVCLVGAYQLSQLYLRYRESPPPSARLLHFPLYVPDDHGEWQREESAELTGLPEYDPRTRELVLLTRFRGVGDCGSLARYRLDDGGPQLVEFRGKAECDGSAEEWPRIVP